MTSPWTHDHLQHVIREEVAAVVYAETHERGDRHAVVGAEAQLEPDREHPAPDVPTVRGVPTVIVPRDWGARHEAQR